MTATAPGSAPSALFTYRNPLDLPRIGWADLLAGTKPGVFIEPPGTPRVLRRAAALFHDDPSGTGLFTGFGPIEVVSPPVFTLSLLDAQLVGFRSLLTAEGLLTNDLGHIRADEARSFMAGFPTTPEIGPFLQAGPDTFALAPQVPPPIHLEGPVVVLSSAEPGNYGAFLYRELPKLVNLPGRPAHWRVLAHVHHASLLEMLELAGVPKDRVILHDLAARYRIDHAIVPGLRAPLALADPGTHALYARLRDRCDIGARGRRLYVSRHSINAHRQTGRVMLNEERLIERLRLLDVEPIEPERLSAREQVAAFASAELVIGPSGAGMFNAVFCRPGTLLIDIESEPHWGFPHSCLFASAGLRYGIVEGSPADRDFTKHHKPFTVDIEALAGRAAALAPPPCRAPGGGMSGPGWSRPDWTGDFYLTVLERLHAALQPQNYLEIGVSTGETLTLARCPSIGVDPNFAIARPVMAGKPSCHLFQQPSDRFFETVNPASLFGTPVALAFLDGMHRYEFLLRDFMHLERHCRPNSVVLLHDCMPTDAHAGRREESDASLSGSSAHPDWWAGDVWKAVLILQQARPDLHITAFDAAPTGLIAITGLDPTSTVLHDRYFDLVASVRTLTLERDGDAYLQGLTVLSTRDYVTPAALGALFWL